MNNIDENSNKHKEFYYRLQWVAAPLGLESAIPLKLNRKQELATMKEQ
jgi:hypothetical protein